MSEERRIRWTEWGYAEYGLFDVVDFEEFEGVVEQQLKGVGRWFGCRESDGSGVGARRLLVRFSKACTVEDARVVLMLGLSDGEVIKVDIPPFGVKVPKEWVENKQGLVVYGKGWRFGKPFDVSGDVSFTVVTYDEEMYVAPLSSGDGKCSGRGVMRQVSLVCEDKVWEQLKVYHHLAMIGENGRRELFFYGERGISEFREFWKAWDTAVKDGLLC